MTADLKVFITPFYRGPDRADGGIRRVIEAQHRFLPEFGITPVERLQDADLVASHAVEHPDVPVGLPWVTHCHGLYWRDFDWQGEWYQKANRQLVEVLRAADHVTAPSEWVAQVLRRGMWLRPTVLPHGVNPEEWEPLPDSEREGYVLWNKARADAASDPGPLDEAARRAPDLPFVTTFGLAQPNVRRTGALPYEDAREVVRRAGVYLCTTRETFGIGTLEAMAAGVPVVGWAWGGQRDIVRHGVTGWLATPGDFDGLMEGIRWAVQYRREAGEAARADVLARWTWPLAIEQYAALYRQMVEAADRQAQAPRVSVIIPCYNLSRYVGETIRSVKAQTDPDFECIIVDDASTDNSAAVIHEAIAGDSRFSYLRNERNQHVSATRNRGIAASRGRYVVCLDADDCITPPALSLLADALDADRGVHLAYGGLEIMSEAGVLRGSPHTWPPPFDFRKQIQGQNQVPTLCMFRRSVYERTGGYRSRISPVEDADLWTRAASLGMVPRKVTDAPALLYRLRPDSISRTMPNPNWVDWYPWSRSPALAPFGVAADPPAGKAAWPVPTYEPVRVSVIIPVGPDHPSIVIDALDSVEAQTYQQWECIVVNDSGVPLPFVPPWAKLLTTAPGGRTGVAHARNMGIAAASAPLLLFLDADDYLQPDALETLIAVQREAGGVVYSQWYDDFGKESRVYDPPEYDARLLTRSGCIHAVTALYPRAAVIAAGGFDEKLSHWEDWDLQLALARDGVCGTKVARPLWTYRKATGARREANAATFAAGRDAVLAKWGRVWEGKEELMACRSCPGGGGGRSAPPSPSASAALAGGPGGPGPGAEGLVLIESLDPSPSVREYRGRATGTRYRFGNIPTARLRYVHAADASQFLNMPDRFRRAPTPAADTAPPAPRLEAPGTAPVAMPAPGAVHQPTAVAPTPEPEPEPEPVRERELPPLSDTEAVAAVQAVAASLSYADVRAALAANAWDKEEIRARLAAEAASPAPRSAIIKLLEKALYDDGALPVARGVAARA